MSEEKETKKKTYGLNLKQRRFCELYASSEEFFGNGVQSYIEAYQPKKVGNWYNSARSSACDLLTNPNILKLINDILELRGLNDVFVDKQLEFLITQYADLKSKLGAVHEYNTLKQRIIKKIDHTTKGAPLYLPTAIIDANNLSPSAGEDSEGQPSV